MMKRLIAGLAAGLLVFAFATPSDAERRSFELRGHSFYFDVPPDYTEKKRDRDQDSETLTFRSEVMLSNGPHECDLVFTVIATTLERHVQDMPDLTIVNGIAYDSRHFKVDEYEKAHESGPIFDMIFASSCSGRCTIGVAVLGGCNYKSSKALIDKYARAITARDFGGD